MDYLTVKEVAEHMDVGEETVRVWLRTGELAGWKLSRKGGWKIAPADLERFREARIAEQAGKALAA